EAERVNEKFLSNLSEDEQQTFILLLNKINRLA
ncbi:MAG TPA: MarR family transcriptional regulator, partial [Shewanella sp.]|nr:MarR family transcriptional regulator [Shewanella sp.]